MCRCGNMVAIRCPLSVSTLFWTQSSLFWPSWLASKTRDLPVSILWCWGCRHVPLIPASTWVLRIWTQVPMHALHISYFPSPVSTILTILFIIYLIMIMSMAKYNFIGNKSLISSNLVAIKWFFCFVFTLIILKFLSSQDHRKVESRLGKQ